MTNEDFEAVKDENAEHPVAAAWRPVFLEVVHAFVHRDYSLLRHVPRVRPVEAETARQISEYIASYGATLAELPDESWETSVAQWMRGYWETSSISGRLRKAGATSFCMREYSKSRMTSKSN